MTLRSLLVTIISFAALAANARGDRAIDALMERISSGLSQKIEVRLQPDSLSDSFTISAHEGRPLITASDRVCAAMGLHTYLKEFTSVQLTWDCMTAPSLPEPLPLPSAPLSRSTDQRLRYYLNYCTHSYSMPFWDFNRWQREIDWMALHGINAPLAMTGMEAVWQATLRRLGYPEERIDRFIAAPAYQAWWLMNNLEGEGAPMTGEWIAARARLQQRILKAMHELDMNPVLPGYSGMVPHDAAETLGLDVADPGRWCAYTRPAFLRPTDPSFARIASIFYDEQQRLYGRARYYSMDPFHEGGNTDGIDLGAAARAIDSAMTAAAPGSVWLIQGWQENPRPQILDALSPERLCVIDLSCETAPQWSSRGHRGHPWLWSMLLNFGGNVGLHGKMQAVISEYSRARLSSTPPAGIGLTMEGIENNPVMFELMTDLPWLKPDEITLDRWLPAYCRARYGAEPTPRILRAWQLLSTSIYNAPLSVRQQGTTESIFCARPSSRPSNVSAWANAEPYYFYGHVMLAARLFVADSALFSSNPHYRYDLIDFERQANAELGRLKMDEIIRSDSLGHRETYRRHAEGFLRLILRQDSLLDAHPAFRLDTWTAAARASAPDPQSAEAQVSDALRLITTWGDREASESGHLHDYAHREWSGLLRDFYYPRWKLWFKSRLDAWDSPAAPDIDFYSFESELLENLR